MAEPDDGRIESEGKRDRDERGHYLPGHSLAGPGRPRGYDFQTILLERVKRKNESVEDAAIRIIDNLLAATEVPSCAAASGKVLLDRICGPVSPLPVHGSEFEPSDEAFA